MHNYSHFQINEYIALQTYFSGMHLFSANAKFSYSKSAHTLPL